MDTRFGAERGLFFDHDVDRDWSGSGELRKNFDFLRLKDFALHILDPRPGMRVLDLGCANGAGMVYCGLQGATVFGQDADARSVAEANDKLAELAISGEARAGDARRLDFDDDSMDAVLSSDFHEHLAPADQVLVLTEVRRVLKPGGHLVLKTPNLSYLRLSLWFKRGRALSRGRSPRGYVIPHAPGTVDPQHIGLTHRRATDAHLGAAGFQNWRWHYAPLRRFGQRYAVDVLSTEVPIVRDWLSEDLCVQAWKPIASSHFPD